MPMNNARTVSFPSGSDMSSAETDKFHYVTLTATRTVVKSASSLEIPFGVLQNTPVTGEAAEVALFGSGNISKIYLSGALATGALVTTTAEVEAGADASTNYNHGILVEGGADTELGQVLLTPITITA